MTQAETIAQIRALRLSVKVTEWNEFRITANVAEISAIWPKLTKAKALEKAESMASYCDKTDREDALGTAKQMRAWLDLNNANAN